MDRKIGRLKTVISLSAALLLSWPGTAWAGGAAAANSAAGATSTAGGTSAGVAAAVAGTTAADPAAGTAAADPAGGTTAADPAAAPTTAAPTTAAPAAGTTAADPTPVPNPPTTPTDEDKGPSGEKDEDPDSGSSLSSDGYELYASGSGKDSISTMRKGKEGKLVVYVKSSSLMTEDVGKNGVTVSKLKDSFRMSGSPKVKVTSDKGDLLEFTATFPKVTYTGKGNELRLRANYKKAGIPSESLSIEISEAEESGSSSRDDDEELSGQPVLTVKRVSPQAPVSAGEAFTLTLKVENTSGDADVEDLMVSLNPAEGLFVVDDTNSRLISRLDTKKSSEITWHMKAGQDIVDPSKSLDVEFKYNYYAGGRITAATASQKVVLPLKGGGSFGQPQIRVGRGEMAHPVTAGQRFELLVSFENTSPDKELRNLSAVFEGNDQLSLMEETDTKLLDGLKPGQAVTIPIHLQAASELSASAASMLGVTLKYDYDSDKGVSQATYSEKIVVPTGGGGKIGVSTPNLIIGTYTYGDMVSAGEVFDLQLELLNTSGSSAVENVIMSLDTGEGISINSSSNTIYIPRMEAGERRKETVRVQALFQSKLQSPKITIAFRYEFQDKNERKQNTSTETIAIPVYQPDRFELKKLILAGPYRAQEEATISLPYVNKGRGQIFNVEAKLEGEIQTLERELSLGNFEAGKSGTIDFVVTPQNTGEFEGKILVSYEDEAMQMKHMEVPVTFSVEAMQEQPMSDFDAPYPEAGAPWKRWVLFAAIAAGLILAGGLWRRVRKKRRRAMEELEESKDGELNADDEYDAYGDGVYGEVDAVNADGEYDMDRSEQLPPVGEEERL